MMSLLNFRINPNHCTGFVLSVPEAGETNKTFMLPHSRQFGKCNNANLISSDCYGGPFDQTAWADGVGSHRRTDVLSHAAEDLIIRHTASRCDDPVLRLMKEAVVRELCSSSAAQFGLNETFSSQDRVTGQIQLLRESTRVCAAAAAARSWSRPTGKMSNRFLRKNLVFTKHHAITCTTSSQRASGTF